MIALLVYVLCLVTSAACAWLLARSYARTRVRLLLWSALCFGCFALNNLLLIVDVSMTPNADLSLVRTIPAVAGIALLLFGLVWETRA